LSIVNYFPIFVVVNIQSDGSEKYIKIILLSGLFQSKLYLPITEMEITKGYTDIWLKRSHLFPEIPYEWVWELKYVKNRQCKQKIIKLCVFCVMRNYKYKIIVTVIYTHV
jgi:hypothetical protein